MIHYSAVEMLLLNEKWIEEHGDHWAAGRIEIYGCEPYGFEYPVSPMHKEDWGRFRNWLDHHVTQELWTFEELIETYERNNQKIRWCNES